jgi:hypothetical protein
MKILTEILRLEHRKAGLYLEEDDHTLYLKQGDEVLARWSATGASRDSILDEADKYIHFRYGSSIP